MMTWKVEHGLRFIFKDVPQDVRYAVRQTGRHIEKKETIPFGYLCECCPKSIDEQGAIRCMCSYNLRTAKKKKKKKEDTP